MPGSPHHGSLHSFVQSRMPGRKWRDLKVRPNLVPCVCCGMMCCFGVVSPCSSRNMELAKGVPHRSVLLCLEMPRYTHTCTQIVPRMNPEGCLFGSVYKVASEANLAGISTV